MEAAVRTPVTIALVNDNDIVVMGIAHILEQYRDRVVIAGGIGRDQGEAVALIGLEPVRGVFRACWNCACNTCRQGQLHGSGGMIKIILGALLLFLAPGLWDSGSEPVPLRGRIQCGT